MLEASDPQIVHVPLPRVNIECIKCMKIEMYLDVGPPIGSVRPTALGKIDILSGRSGCNKKYQGRTDLARKRVVKRILVGDAARITYVNIHVNQLDDEIVGAYYTMKSHSIVRSTIVLHLCSGRRIVLAQRARNSPK
jgi:hypothetical protein